MGTSNNLPNQVKIRLSDEDHEKLEKIAVDQDISLTRLVSKLVDEYLEDDTKKTPEELKIENIGIRSPLENRMEQLENAILKLESTAKFRSLTRDQLYDFHNTFSKTLADFEYSKGRHISSMNEFTEKLGTESSKLSQISKELESASAFTQEIKNYHQTIKNGNAKTSKYLDYFENNMENLVDNMKEICNDNSEKLSHICRSFSNKMALDFEDNSNTLSNISSSFSKASKKYNGIFLAAVLGVSILIFSTIIASNYYKIFYPDPAWFRQALLTPNNPAKGH